MQNLLKENYVIITGGPGMGKTAITENLAEMGYENVQEVGRKIIKEQVSNNGNALPWADKALFAKFMFDASLSDFIEKSNSPSTVFFDRGIPDVIGYLELCKLPIPLEMSKAACNLRYHNKVFITPPWKEIYENDKERKQSFEEAQATFDMMNKIYTRLDYKVITLPTLTVKERSSFIISHLEGR